MAPSSTFEFSLSLSLAQSFAQFNSIWLIVESIAFNQNTQTTAAQIPMEWNGDCKCKFTRIIHSQWLDDGAHKEHFYVVDFLLALMFMVYIFFLILIFSSLSKQNFACIDCARSHLIYVDIKSILHIYSFVWCDILFANFFGCFMFFVLFFVSPNLVAHLYIGIDFGAAVWSLLSFFSSPSISRIVIHNIKFEFCNGVNVCFCPVDCNNNEQQKCIHLERLLELRICERARLWHAHQIKYHSIIDCIDDGSNAIFAMSHNNSMMAFSVSTLHISLSLSIHVLFMLRVHKPKKNLSSALGRSDIARKYAHRTHTYRYPHA